MDFTLTSVWAIKFASYRTTYTHKVCLCQLTLQSAYMTTSVVYYFWSFLLIIVSPPRSVTLLHHLLSTRRTYSLDWQHSLISYCTHCTLHTPLQSFGTENDIQYLESPAACVWRSVLSLLLRTRYSVRRWRTLSHRKRIPLLVSVRHSLTRTTPVWGLGLVAGWKNHRGQPLQNGQNTGELYVVFNLEIPGYKNWEVGG
jgi:hypothetical protein